MAAANRNAFVQLVLSNVFGQNAPAIAAAEATMSRCGLPMAAMVRLSRWGIGGGGGVGAMAAGGAGLVRALLGGLRLTHRRPLQGATKASRADLNLGVGNVAASAWAAASAVPTWAVAMSAATWAAGLRQPELGQRKHRPAMPAAETRVTTALAAETSA